MAELNTQPGSCTPRQRQRIVLAGKRRGMNVDEVRRLAGSKLHDLSSAQASALIKRLSGEDLPNRPGEKPRSYRGNPKAGTIRMITYDQCHHIDRLMMEYFARDSHRAAIWLQKNFKASETRLLATAKRGGEVIAVLKRMLARKKENQACPF